jgi:hypothetical protein
MLRGDKNQAHRLAKECMVLDTENMRLVFFFQVEVDDDSHLV